MSGSVALEGKVIHVKNGRSKKYTQNQNKFDYTNTHTWTHIYVMYIWTSDLVLLHLNIHKIQRFIPFG